MSVWEQRWHPIREEWVIVAAHRQNRPWTGETISRRTDAIPEYDPGCYLCPGNKRIGGARNPDYELIHVFDNDMPCVSPEAGHELEPAPGINRNSTAEGISRVVCYNRKHNVSLAEMSEPEIAALVLMWREQYIELGNLADIAHVLIFENKGEVVGVSNPHPHCQIYATNFVFKYIETEARVSERHLNASGKVLFEDIIAAEKQDGRRIICENELAIAFIPYFARYAYEVYVAPKSARPSLAEFSEREIEDFVRVLKQTLIKFDNLWQMPFPYVMTLHQAPTNGADYRGFHFHIEFHPPLRKPNLLKYLAGPEIGGGNFLSDTAPEAMAAELRSQSDVHYKSATV